MIKMLLKFALVGLSGVGVNMAVYLSLTALNANYLVAAVGSFIVAVTSNFIGNVLWTFKGRAQAKSIRTKYFSFIAISAINLGVNLIVLRLLVEYLRLGETLAQFCAIAVVSGLNFILQYLITFGDNSDKQQKEALLSYETGCNTNIQ